MKTLIIGTKRQADEIAQKLARGIDPNAPTAQPI
jgi:hypothetical protein